MASDPASSRPPVLGVEHQGDDAPAVPDGRAAEAIAPHVAGALCYLFGILSGAFLLVASGDRPFVRFHAIQSIFFSLAWFGLWMVLLVIGIILQVVPVLGALVELGAMLALGVVGLGLWLYVMVQAFQGREWEIPALGAIVRRQMSRTYGGASTTGLVALLALGSGIAPTPTPAAAQDFEGTLVQRTITVASAGVRELLGDPDEVDPEQLFAVPLDEVFALGEAAPGITESERAVIRVRGSTVRTDAGEGESYALFDWRTGMIQLVEPEARTYLELSTEQMRGAAGDPETAGPTTAPDVQVRRLGERRTIAGVPGTAYAVTHGEAVARVWVTEHHPGLRQVVRTLVEASPDEEGDDAALLALLERGFPLVTQTYESGWDGGKYTVEETISITPEALPPDLFDIPAGYTRQSVPGLGGGR